jgi:hypothetical protein
LLSFVYKGTSCDTAEFIADLHETGDRGYNQHDKILIGASQMCPKEEYYSMEFLFTGIPQFIAGMAAMAT